MRELPGEFTAMLTDICGVHAPALTSALADSEPSLAVRINKLKGMSVPEGRDAVPWLSDRAFYLDSRPLFAADPAWHQGLYYVQDASSMIVTDIVAFLSREFFGNRQLHYLDACAAPGGKTIAAIEGLPQGSAVLSNEYDRRRASALVENIAKYGYPATAVSCGDASALGRLGPVFDIVAVDAPCSGEGMMRKEEVAVTQWNTGLQRQCAELQREILSDAIEALKPGGFMIYSTCTFNREENEENLRWLVEEKGLCAVDMDFPEEWGISKGIDTPYPCMRFMPHKTRGEGLFAAVLRKEGDYPRAAGLSETAFVKTLKKNTRIIAEGIPQTVTKGRDEIPASESVLATDYNPDSLPSVEVDEATALSYLRHEALRLDSEVGKGFVVIKYRGYPLGLVKNIGNRANNLYPSQWRIKFL